MVNLSKFLILNSLIQNSHIAVEPDKDKIVTRNIFQKHIWITLVDDFSLRQAS